MKRKPIKAVENSDVPELLSRLGLIERLENRDLRCYICGEVITLTNFGGMRKTRDEMLLFCDSIQCIIKGSGNS